MTLTPPRKRLDKEGLQDSSKGDLRRKKQSHHGTALLKNSPPKVKGGEPTRVGKSGLHEPRYLSHQGDPPRENKYNKNTPKERHMLVTKKGQMKGWNPRRGDYPIPHGVVFEKKTWILIVVKTWRSLTFHRGGGRVFWGRV